MRAEPDPILTEAQAVLGTDVFSVEALSHSSHLTVTASVARVTTEGRSAVVKVLSSRDPDPSWGGSHEPSHPRSWRREPALYVRGLPAEYLDAGIDAPKLLGSFDRPDGVSLWLEDLDGATGSEWTARTYSIAAKRLGVAQGLLANRPDAAEIWSRGFLADYMHRWDTVGWDRVDDDAAWATPLLRSHYTPELRRALAALCHDRHRLVGWAELLPQSICHHDVWVNNGFMSGDRVTLIDWAFAGHGHLGTDVGNLVSDSCGDLLHPTTALPIFDDAATVAYRDGLEEAGWQGDFRPVRLGMCLMAAKWSWLVPVTLERANDQQHRVYGGREVDTEHLYAERAAMLEFFVRWADEARSLAAELGID